MKNNADPLRIRSGFAAFVGVLFIASAQAQLPPPTPLPLPTPGQTPVQTPTVDQLRMLQQLPESERQELMRALGITEFDLQQQATGDLRLQQAAPVPLSAPGADERTGPPILEAGSTVIVKLRLPRAQGADLGCGTTHAAAGGAVGFRLVAGDRRRAARTPGTGATRVERIGGSGSRTSVPAARATEFATRPAAGSRHVCSRSRGPHPVSGRRHDSACRIDGNAVGAPHRGRVEPAAAGCRSDTAATRAVRRRRARAVRLQTVSGSCADVFPGYGCARPARIHDRTG